MVPVFYSLCRLAPRSHVCFYACGGLPGPGSGAQRALVSVTRRRAAGPHDWPAAGRHCASASVHGTCPERHFRPPPLVASAPAAKTSPFHACTAARPSADQPPPGRQRAHACLRADRRSCAHRSVTLALPHGGPIRRFSMRHQTCRMSVLAVAVGKLFKHINCLITSNQMGRQHKWSRAL